MASGSVDLVARVQPRPSKSDARRLCNGPGGLTGQLDAIQIRRAVKSLIQAIERSDVVLRKGKKQKNTRRTADLTGSA